MLALSLLCVGSLLASAPRQDVEITRPEPGLEVHTSYAVGAAGERVREGLYRVLSSRGPVLVEGAFVAGRREGDWFFRTLDGDAFARGPYVGGAREGEWTLYSGSPGAVFAKGRFIAGRPSRAWKFPALREPRGAVRTGRIEAVQGELPAGVIFEGFVFDGQPHGHWKLDWSDGSPLMRCVFDQGVPIGEHTFQLPGGVPSFGMAAARFDGEWSDPGRALHAAIFADFDDLGRVFIVDAVRPPSLADALRALQSLPDVVGAPSEREVTLGARSALRDLFQVDWDSAPDVERMRQVVSSILLPRLPGTEGDWDWSGGPGSSERNRAALLRVYGYYWLAPYFDDYVDLDFALRALDPAFQTPYTKLMACLLPIPEWAAGRTGDGWTGGRPPRVVESLNLRAAGGSGTEQALRDALAWLSAHQDTDGRWDCDEFMKHDPPADQCSGPGESYNDEGVTGLALLALLRAGEVRVDGLYGDTFVRGLGWLLREQDADGAFAPRSSKGLYDQAIVTLLLSEVLASHDSSLVRSAAQRAVNYLMRARNPYGAWRYTRQPRGDNDSSITSWAVCALGAARRVGLTVDPECFLGAKNWFDEVTDPATGRCGYDSIGSMSSRVERRNEEYPVERGEAMTAAALYCRFVMGERPDTSVSMRTGAVLLLRNLPEWQPSQRANDMYYWYYASYAMFQMGGLHWETWNKTLKPAVVDSQRLDGASKGSWDPIGPWGFAGGRVYSTSIMALTLATYRQERLWVSGDEADARKRQRR